MTELEIHLLGRPRIERAGVLLPAPRGFKSWGLLAYLLCAVRPPTRNELVTQLFGEADDPLAALRWNLSTLRRALPGAEIGGDPLTLVLPPGAFVDVLAVTRGSWTEALAVPELDRELLEGMVFSSSAAFEIWLMTQRRHLGAMAEAVLREAALARLGAGDAAAAVELAGRLVGINPFDENFQTLLVRALAASGNGVEAARQVARCRDLFRRELGIDPSPALTAASEALGTSASGSVSGRAAAGAQLEAGEAAIAAGALDAGLQCLRRAIDDARNATAAELQARALLALGSALVHAARGRDEEAAGALHEALDVATRTGRLALAAAASRELGYVEFLRGRYERAEEWLDQARELARGEPRESGHIGSVLGSVLSDVAHYDRALKELRAAIVLSRAAGDDRRVAYSLAMVGRVYLLRGDLVPAARMLDEALGVTRAENWTTFTPWPLALRGDVALLEGGVDAASECYEHAFALGCQLGDPCWEGIAARGIGMVAAARGEADQALDWLGDARRRCARLPDAYLWVEAYTLDALCAFGIDNGLKAAGEWVDELALLSGRSGMRDLAVRACVHRSRLGDASALTAGRMLAAGIESPALDALFAEHVRR